MLTYEFIKTKMSICIFITIAWLVGMLLWALSPIDVIGEIRERAVVYIFFFMIVLWVLNTQLLINISKLDTETKQSLKLNIIGLCLSYFFIVISYFIWKSISEKFNTKYEMEKICYAGSKKNFILINCSFWITVMYAWTIFFLIFTPQFSNVMSSELMMILGLTIIPSGILSIALLVYLLMKFKNVYNILKTNPKFNIYSELVWLTFFFPLVGIWLTTYVNKKLSYAINTIISDTKILSRSGVSNF